MVGISGEKYSSVQKIRRVKKKLLGRKILSFMKLEGENWKMEGGPVTHAPIHSGKNGQQK